MKVVEATLKNEEGLHARPAGEVLKKAAGFKSKISIIKNGDRNKQFDPKSIFSILSMGAAKGDVLTISAEGEDEAAAADQLKELIEGGFSH